MPINMANKMVVGNSSGGGLFRTSKNITAVCVCGHTTVCPVCNMSSPATHVSTDMEWSNEKVLEVLELFQSEPSLWDTRQKNFNNRSVQNYAWRRIKSFSLIDHLIFYLSSFSYVEKKMHVKIIGTHKTQHHCSFSPHFEK